MDVCILMSSCFCSASWACDSIRPAPLALGTVRTDHATKLNQTKDQDQRDVLYLVRR